MKAPDAFRTISEVAEDLDLPQHVLRFWETRFTQIKPMKRGGGRRYYRPEDVDLLRGIRPLLYAEGFTIRGVQRLLKEKGLGFVVAAGQGGSRAAAAKIPPRGEPDLDFGREADVSDPLQAEADIETEPRAQSVVEFPIRPTQPSGGGSVMTIGLGKGDRRKLEHALSELVEVKRLLDQAR